MQFCATKTSDKDFCLKNGQIRPCLLSISSQGKRNECIT